jgi:PilZ domain-containing protein
MFWSRSASSKERRSEPRLSVNEIVRIEHRGHEKGLGCLRDVSRGGAYVATTHRLRAGEKVRLRLTSLDSGIDDAIIVEARVTRRRQDGMAVRWRDFAPPCVLELIAWQQQVIHAPDHHAPR